MGDADEPKPVVLPLAQSASKVELSLAVTKLCERIALNPKVGKAFTAYAQAYRALQAVRSEDEELQILPTTVLNEARIDLEGELLRSEVLQNLSGQNRVKHWDAVRDYFLYDRVRQLEVRPHGSYEETVMRTSS